MPNELDEAHEAGLRYTTDARPGIRRRRAGRGLSYHRPGGEPVRDPATLARIRALAVPPAWSDVWISTDPSGHLQATGRDARGRKQYRYHPAWRLHRDETKFDRLADFGVALPRIRRRVDRDLARRGLPREKVLALVVRLLELTLIRVGNDEYARLNRSFGLTTLLDRHARVEGAVVRFRFRGKSARQHAVTIHDRRLARLVARCQELPGQELFQYEAENGSVTGVTSEDVNAYLREATGDDFTAKEFRTWAGTLLAFRALCALEPLAGRDGAHAIAGVIADVAERLGNTPAVCRTSYVHPAVVEAYVEGSLVRALLRAVDDGAPPPSLSTPAEEAALVRLLRRRRRNGIGRSRDRHPRHRARTAA